MGAVTEPVAELPGVGGAMPMRNVEWNQRYSGGPPELLLMGRYGRRTTAVGAGGLCDRCGGRFGPACILRGGTVGLIIVAAPTGRAVLTA